MFSNVVNLLLTPAYTAFLTPVDYGNLGLLALFSTLAKIVFRMGLDAGFFRVHYDLGEAERRKLAGCVALFAAATSTLLFAAVVLARVPLAALLLGQGGRPEWILLAAADVYFGSFSFVPQSLLRIQDRPGLFSAFAAGRHAINAGLKLTLVVTGFGVTGVLLSDAIATGLFSLALLPILKRGAQAAWTPAALGEVLRFGLPKVPHGLLLQIQNLADRRILAAFVSRADVGLYHQGYTLGAGVKFALSAFEPAWQPFVYAGIGKPDARLMLARVVTYAWAVFLGLGLVFAVLGRELLQALTPFNHDFWAAAPVIPVVVLAYLFHGAFLLGSVGIAISKRARYYPVITAVAAAVNLAGNLALIPRFGMLGAAWATVLSYAVTAGLGFLFSQRLYPIPLEWPRLGRVTAAAAGVFALSLLAPAPLLWALLVKALALGAFPVLLVALGTLRAEEKSWLGHRLRASLRVWP